MFDSAITLVLEPCALNMMKVTHPALVLLLQISIPSGLVRGNAPVLIWPEPQCCFELTQRTDWQKQPNRRFFKTPSISHRCKCSQTNCAA
jgi:hypothetical protein